MINSKAYGLFSVKSFDEDERILKGIATTPTADRYEDIVEPTGAKFTLPIPFLWQHDHSAPLGEVKSATITQDGIEVEIQVAKVTEEGTLKNRIDEAWQSIKSGLVRGLSIGFVGTDVDLVKNGSGLHFKEWDWYELSAVTIPANVEASITSIKKFSQSTPEDINAIVDVGRENPPIVGDSAKHIIVNLLPPITGGVKLNER